MGLEEFNRYLADVNKIFKDENYKKIMSALKKITENGSSQSVRDQASKAEKYIRAMEMLFNKINKDMKSRPYNLSSKKISDSYLLSSQEMNIVISLGYDQLGEIGNKILNRKNLDAFYKEFLNEVNIDKKSFKSLKNVFNPVYLNRFKDGDIEALSKELDEFQKKGVKEEVVAKTENEKVVEVKEEVAKAPEEDPTYIKEQEKFEKLNNVDHNKIDDANNIGESVEPNANIDKKLKDTKAWLGDDRDRELYVQTVSTLKAFTPFIDKLEAAMTGYNSGEYKNIIKYLRSINTKSNSFDENTVGYAAKLIKTKEYINKYLDHKASTSVKQNAYKKLAAVEALNKEIEKRIDDLYKFVATRDNVDLTNLLYQQKLNTRDELTEAPELTVDELSDKSIAAQKKGIDVKDIVDMKFTDDCMRRIIYKASEDYKTNVGAMEAMRLQFQNNPSKVVVEAPNAEAANVNQPQPQNAPVV